MVTISNNMLVALKTGTKQKMVQSITENIDAHITLTPTNTAIRINAYLRTKTPSERIDAVRPVTITAKNYSTLPYDVRNACNLLIAKYSRLHEKAHHAPKSLKAFSDRVMHTPNILDPNNYLPYTKTGWGKATTKNAVTYYAYTIGKFYTQYGKDANVSDFQTFLEDEIDRIYATNYQRPCQDGQKIRQRRENIYNNIMSNWTRAQCVQRFLLANHPEGNWPKTLIPVAPRFRTATVEEIKAIPHEQYVKVIALLIRLCTEGNPYAYASLGEAFLGLRAGESCAPLLGDFEQFGIYGRYYVGHQVDENRNRTNILKTGAAYRYVFYDSCFVSLLDLRKQQLTSAGFSMTEIPLIPLASRISSPYDFLAKSDVSSFLRHLLVLSGCDDKWLTKQSEAMFVAAKVAGNSEDLDVCAHLLRRTLATYWANGGIPEKDVDYILGHTNTATKSTDYASPDIIPSIVQMIIRSMPTSYNAESISAVEKSTYVSRNSNYLLHGNMQYTFFAETDIYVDLSLGALEPQSEIILQTSTNWRAKDLQHRPTPDTLKAKQSRPILTPMPTADDILKWTSEANKIDLSEVRRHWS